MQIGIIGLPNSGKTTVFNALTGLTRPTSAVTATKLEIQTGTVDVPDPRVEKVQVIRHARVRRARLYYLRGRTGKAARLKSRQDDRTSAQG